MSVKIDSSILASTFMSKIFSDFFPTEDPIRLQERVSMGDCREVS